MYWPRHRPQLTGIPTASLDCGTRSTQMGLDAASGGEIVPSIARIRDVMQDQDATNALQWDRVIDRLGAKLGIHSELTGDPGEIRRHLRDKMPVIWTVHYGRLRRSAPNRTGSESFDGYHAMLSLGWRDNDEDAATTRSFDSLLDGRYRGCPNGPIWLQLPKLIRAAKRASSTSLWSCALLFPPADIEGPRPTPAPEPEPLLSLVDVVARLRELAHAGADVEDLVRSLDLIIGPGNVEADALTAIDGSEAQLIAGIVA